MTSVTPERFDELVSDALDGLPDWVLENMVNVEVTVEDDPPPGEVTLLGHYQGVPLTRRASGYTSVVPDRITLYRSTLQRVSRSEDELRDRVRRTIAHEIAHFFGISDDRLREIDRY